MSDDWFELVIDMRTGGDWSLDLCFAGLVYNLGHNHVVDVPWKHKHREWEHSRQFADWGMERRTLGYTPFNTSIGRMGDPELKSCINERRVRRVWLDERMESFQEYRKLGLYDAKVPVVVVAGHDRFWNQSPSFVAQLYGERLQAMLLDNWYPEYANLPFRTRRIGWSCNFDHYWERPAVPPEKHIDICFVGYNSHPDRARFIDHIERNWAGLRNHIYLERRPDCFEEFMAKKTLFTIMQQSRICLNLRGAADRGKTLRAYEIPYVGSFMLTQDIEDPGMRQDFKSLEHCCYFSNESELDRTIEWALKNETLREAIASEGHARVVDDLSARARWGDVIKWLNE
jgi:hypothetical protein